MSAAWLAVLRGGSRPRAGRGAGAPSLSSWGSSPWPSRGSRPCRLNRDAR
ncbi:hypothetical protein QJS66_12855 [Kocuria rhizophila]|nr:hypothetical protein QJS66_12855 [Kocuria rhizophila]